MRLDVNSTKEFSFDAWNVLLIYRSLVCHAMAGEIISYSDLAEELDLQFYNSKMELDDYSYKITNHRQMFGWLLQPISNYTNSQQGILLTSIVVLKSDNIPGKGFFDMAVELERLDPNENDAGRRSFAEQEQRNVFKHYYK